jgi:glycosyltransferase involved in cell wall biosynthesis
MPEPLIDPRSAASSEPLIGRDMLCFSHDWSGDPLSKTHLMRIFARQNRILWVNSIGYRSPSLTSHRDWGRIVRKLKAVAEPIREVEPNIFVFNPLSIPAFGNRGLRAVSARLLREQIRWAMRKLRFRNPVNWVFNPAAGVLAGQLNEAEIIYYCVDEYTSFRGVDTATLAEIERSLIGKSDLVIVSAEKLRQSKQTPNSPPPILIRHGVDFEHFASVFSSQTSVPEDLAGLPKPVIGYFGLIAEDWVDIPLLVRVARSFPHASLVMLGKATMDVSALLREPNIHLLGRKPYSALPGYCKGFDVALIPFPISEVTLNANPLKAREYLAAGLPVVSTAIPEVEVLGECSIGRTGEEFVAEIRRALLAPGPETARSRRMAMEGWSARVEEIRRQWPGKLAKTPPSSVKPVMQ